jgi:predicted acetyltransferase
MAIEVRTCAHEELKAALTPIMHFFGRVPTDEWTDRIRHALPADRMHAAFENGAVVGGAAVFPREVAVPGGRLPAAGVTLVAVLPTHRRRGILTQLMRAQLDDVRERGEPLAALWASEGAIYGRFGYGVASLGGEIDLPRRYGAFAMPFEPVGATRLVDLEEALDAFPPVYERVLATTPGMFARSEDWWRQRTLHDPESRRREGGEMMRVLLEVDGAAVAYALYRLHVGFEYGAGVGHTSVIEAMGATPSATQAIWRFLLDLDWMQSVRAYHLPVDHPLFVLLPEPRRMRFTVSDALWMRLVDVAGALSGRAYADGRPVVFQLSDAFCPWNEGRWRVADGTVERTAEAAGLALDVSALASVYLGGFTFGGLARAGRVEELQPGAVGAADAVFQTDRRPWCPEVF